MEELAKVLAELLKLIKDNGLAVTLVTIGTIVGLIGLREGWKFFLNEVWRYFKLLLGGMQRRFVRHLDRLDTCTSMMVKSLDSLDDTLRECQHTISTLAEGQRDTALAVKACQTNPALRDHHADRAAGKAILQRPPVDPPEPNV